MTEQKQLVLPIRIDEIVKGVIRIRMPGFDGWRMGVVSVTTNCRKSRHE